MLSYLENKPFLTIIITVLIMLVFSINSVDITIMEARNFITAREMIEDGNWILTTMNGEPRYEKPPLPTWLSAISALVFGLKNLFALRFPAILMVMVTGIGSYILSLKLLSNQFQSFINALITITSLYVVVIIIEAPWDIYTHGFMLLGIYFLFRLFEESNLKWKLVFGAGIAVGCSILSKGPISFYALLLPFLISYGIVYQYKGIRKKIIPLLVVLILSLIIGGFWYAYVRLADPESFVAIAKRETSNWSSYNVKPIYYYWSFFTQSGLWTIPAFVSLMYPYLKTRVSNLKVYRFSFYWTIIAVILLSIIPEKKSRYLMPVLIPLAINTGFYIEYLIRKSKDLKLKESFIAYFHFGLIILICLAIPFIGLFLLNDKPDINWWIFSVDSIILLSIGVLGINNLFKKNIKALFYISIFFYVALLTVGIPYTETFKNPNYKNIAELKSDLMDKDLKLFAYGKHVAPETLWHYDDKIPNIIQVDSTYSLPDEIRFALIASKIYPENDSILKNTYSLELISEYDMNTANPETKAHKSRLLNKIYILSKK